MKYGRRFPMMSS
jgi:cathepsin C